MEDNSNKKYEIIFEGENDPIDIISEILKNNGLEETDDEYLEKIEQGKTAKTDILYETTKKLAKGDLSEKDLISFIKNQMGISEEIATNIMSEIQKKLLPIAKKTSFNSETPEEKPITAKPTRLIVEKPLPASSKPIESPAPSAENIEDRKDTENVTDTLEEKPKKTRKRKTVIVKKEEEKIENKTGQTVRNNKQDGYREPIE